MEKVYNPSPASELSNIYIYIHSHKINGELTMCHVFIIEADYLGTEASNILRCHIDSLSQHLISHVSVHLLFSERCVIEMKHISDKIIT